MSHGFSQESSCHFIQRLVFAGGDLRQTLGQFIGI